MSHINLDHLLYGASGAGGIFGAARGVTFWLERRRQTRRDDRAAERQADLEYDEQIFRLQSQTIERQGQQLARLQERLDALDERLQELTGHYAKLQLENETLTRELQLTQESLRQTREQLAQANQVNDALRLEVHALIQMRGGQGDAPTAPAGQPA